MALADTLYALLIATNIAAPPAGMTETEDEKKLRLRSIADDAAFVANDDPSDALLILAVAHHESGFALDVDKGPCRAGTCDGGHAACMMQIWSNDPKERARLFADRRACFEKGLKALHNSRDLCGPGELVFSAYAAGSCISEAGHKGSRELYRYWLNWQGRYGTEKAREDKAAK